MIQHYTQQIWNHLRELNSPAVKCLKGGLARWEILEICEAAGFSACDSVVAFYEWKNGTDIMGAYQKGLYMRDADIFPHFHANSLEKALEIWKSEYVPEVEMQFLNGVADPWLATWLPLFSDDGDAHYVVDTATEQVIYIDENWHTEVMFESLEEMLAQISSHYATGRYVLDAANEGFLTEIE